MNGRSEKEKGTENDMKNQEKLDTLRIKEIKREEIQVNKLRKGKSNIKRRDDLTGKK